MLTIGLRGSVRATAVTDQFSADLHDVTAIRAGLTKIELSLFRLDALDTQDTVTQGTLYAFSDSNARCLCTVYVSHYQAIYVIKKR